MTQETSWIINKLKKHNAMHVRFISYYLLPNGDKEWFSYDLKNYPTYVKEFAYSHVRHFVKVRADVFSNMGWFSLYKNNSYVNSMSFEGLDIGNTNFMHIDQLKNSKYDNVCISMFAQCMLKVKNGYDVGLTNDMIISKANTNDFECIERDLQIV